MDNNKVADVIQAIADKLGVAAVHLWPEMVRYTWANSLAWLIFQVALVLFALWFIPNRVHYCMRILDRDSDNYHNDSDAIAFSATAWAVAMLLIGFAAMGCLLNIPDNLSKVMAPEGATVMQMLRAASGK